MQPNGTSQTARGLVTYVKTLGKPGVCASYDIAGNAVKSREPATLREVAYSITEATKYMLPSMETPNGNANLASSCQWNGLLGLTQAAGPNGATKQDAKGNVATYWWDSYGRMT